MCEQEGAEGVDGEGFEEVAVVDGAESVVLFGRHDARYVEEDVDWLVVCEFGFEVGDGAFGGDLSSVSLMVIWAAARLGHSRSVLWVVGCVAFGRFLTSSLNFAHGSASIFSPTSLSVATTS